MKVALLIFCLASCKFQAIAQAYTLHTTMVNNCTDTGFTGEKSINIPVTIYTANGTDTVRKIEILYSKPMTLTVDSVHRVINNTNGEVSFDGYCIDQNGNRYYLTMGKGTGDKTWSILSILNEKSMIKNSKGQQLSKDDMKGSAMLYLEP